MAEAIRRFRAALGDTQQAFARKTNLTLTTIARYETNSQPSDKVLAGFAVLAQKAHLPLFVDIFEGRLIPEAQIFEQQEVSAIVETLKGSFDALYRTKTGHQKARLLFAIHLLSPAKYAEAEDALLARVQTATFEDALNRVAGDYLRRGEPRIGAEDLQDENRWPPELFVDLLFSQLQGEDQPEGAPFRSGQTWQAVRNSIINNLKAQAHQWLKVEETTQVSQQQPPSDSTREIRATKKRSGP
jgi:transcriptional regulator with XRE-family HTH domain